MLVFGVSRATPLFARGPALIHSFVHSSLIPTLIINVLCLLACLLDCFQVPCFPVCFLPASALLPTLPPPYFLPASYLLPARTAAQPLFLPTPARTRLLDVQSLKSFIHPFLHSNNPHPFSFYKKKKKERLPALETYFLKT